MNPVEGDIITTKHSRHKVTTVRDGVVYYLDERLADHVPLSRWRLWYAGKDDCKVVKRGDE